jgi:hypothetical protein
MGVILYLKGEMRIFLQSLLHNEEIVRLYSKTDFFRSIWLGAHRFSVK